MCSSLNRLHFWFCLLRQSPSPSREWLHKWTAEIATKYYQLQWLKLSTGMRNNSRLSFVTSRFSEGTLNSTEVLHLRRCSTQRWNLSEARILGNFRFPSCPISRFSYFHPISYFTFRCWHSSCVFWHPGTASRHVYSSYHWPLRWPSTRDKKGGPCFALKSFSLTSSYLPCTACYTVATHTLSSLSLKPWECF